MDKALAGNSVAGDFMAQFAMLISKQMALYTLGESSSVSEDEAYRLMESAIYACGVDPDDPGEESMAKAVASGVESAHRAGVKRLEAEAKRARRLLIDAALMCLPNSAIVPDGDDVLALLNCIENEAVGHALQDIDVFLRTYDPRFFCAETPLFLEYQPKEPLNISLRGADYVCAYLETLISP